MKKVHILAIVILVLLLPAMLLTLSACDGDDIYHSVIRIHIRANSNSQADQAVKLQVRDDITAYLTQILQNCRTKKQAAKTLEANAQNIAKIANSTLYQNNFEYKASVRLNNEYFPERIYGEYTFPAGRYDALIVELGSGEGQNWWCVAFPPLCFVPNSSGGEKVVYKSWIKEILDRIFG